MNAVSQWFSQYWMYALGLVGAIVVFAVVLKMAVKSYKAYYKRYRAQESEMKKLQELKEKYGELTEEAIENGEEADLLQGVALSYQLKLQKCSDMTAEFNKFNDEKKFVYALDVFVSDANVKTFFSENGKELTEIIVPALKMIGLDETAKKAEKIRLMYDIKDETVSFSPTEIKEVQQYIDDNGILTKIKLNGAEYIKNNAESFV
ncbi:MAG: hypothetical protein ACI4SB_00190 [Acutalibacteraceae bacterium]